MKAPSRHGLLGSCSLRRVYSLSPPLEMARSEFHPVIATSSIRLCVSSSSLIRTDAISIVESARSCVLSVFVTKLTESTSKVGTITNSTVSSVLCDSRYEVGTAYHACDIGLPSAGPQSLQLGVNHTVLAELASRFLQHRTSCRHPSHRLTEDPKNLIHVHTYIHKLPTPSIPQTTPLATPDEANKHDHAQVQPRLLAISPYLPRSLVVSYACRTRA